MKSGEKEHWRSRADEGNGKQVFGSTAQWWKRAWGRSNTQRSQHKRDGWTAKEVQNQEIQDSSVLEHMRRKAEWRALLREIFLTKRRWRGQREKKRKRTKLDRCFVQKEQTACGWNLTRNQLFYKGRSNRAGHSDRTAINDKTHIRQRYRLKKVNVDALGPSRATDVHGEKQVLSSSRQKGVRKKSLRYEIGERTKRIPYQVYLLR